VTAAIHRQTACLTVCVSGSGDAGKTRGQIRAIAGNAAQLKAAKPPFSTATGWAY